MTAAATTGPPNPVCSRLRPISASVSAKPMTHVDVTRFRQPRRA